MYMQQEKIRNAVCWFAVVACMIVIFCFSARTADESAAQSGTLLNFFQKIFGDNFITDFMIRKSAHFLEFTGLAVLFNLALFFQTKHIQPFLSIVFTSLYAVTDEIHQLFVDGRACRVGDWAIDTAGAAAGTIGFLILFALIKKIISAKGKN